MLSRKTAALWSVLWIFLTAVVVVGGLAYMEMPGSLVWGAAGFFLLMIILAALGAFRGAAKRAQRAASFESNALGAPLAESFEPPYNRDLEPDPGEQTRLGAAPIMQVASGLGDLFKGGLKSALGKAVVRDAENAVLLTDRRLLFVMIGPRELSRYAPNGKVTKLLEALPGDASAKRRMLWQRGGDEVRQALEGIRGDLGLAGIQQELFSFSIPVQDIQEAALNAPKRLLTLLLPLEQRLSYAFRGQDELQALAGGLQELGVSLRGQA